MGSCQPSFEIAESAVDLHGQVQARMMHVTSQRGFRIAAREMQGRKVILPLWQGITKEEILKHSLLLPAKLAAPTGRGVDVIAQEIFAIARPNAALPVGDAVRPEKRRITGKQTEELTELLRTIDDVAPLLHKLDAVLTGTEACLFLGAMQKKFYGSNILTEITDKNLRFGADNLLRILSCEGLHPPRRQSSLCAVIAEIRFHDDSVDLTGRRGNGLKWLP
jgi:hypothetical protein